MSNRNTRIRIQADVNNHQQVKQYPQSNTPNKNPKTKSKQQILKNLSANDLNHLHLSEAHTYSQSKNNNHFHRQINYSPMHNNQTEVENGYKKIQIFLQNQNHNLRQQNKMLMNQINIISKKQKKYKDLYHQKVQELNIVEQQKNIYLKQAQQLKAISMHQMNNFKKKLQFVRIDSSSIDKQSAYQSLECQGLSINSLSSSDCQHQQYKQDYKINYYLN